MLQYVYFAVTKERDEKERLALVGGVLFAREEADAAFVEKNRSCVFKKKLFFGAKQTVVIDRFFAVKFGIAQFVAIREEEPKSEKQRVDGKLQRQVDLIRVALDLIEDNLDIHNGTEHQIKGADIKKQLLGDIRIGISQFVHVCSPH